MNPSPVDSASDRRTSFRVPAVEQRVARLRISRREILVEVTDESAAGFAILLGGTLQCHVGQTALLQTTAGWVEVRIMNAKVGQAVVASEGDASREVPCTRLGLQRVRDLPLERRTRWLAAILQATHRPLAPLYSTWSGALVTASIVACGGALFVFGLEFPRSVITFVGRDLPPPSAPQEPSLSRQTPIATNDWIEIPWSLGIPLFSGGLSDDERWSPELVRMTRPEFLLRADTTKTLALTEYQLRRLRAISEQRRRQSSQHPWNREAAQSVITLLTGEQRATLVRMAGQ